MGFTLLWLLYHGRKWQNKQIWLYGLIINYRRDGDNMKSWENALKLVISLLSTLFAISIVYVLSRYYEDMSGAVLFVGGLLIGRYLQEEGDTF